MRYIREMIQKGDPRISVFLPKTLVAMLKELAKSNKRRYQDEFIKRIARTLRFPDAFAALEKDHETYLVSFYKVTDNTLNQNAQITLMEKFIQIMPRELYDELKLLAMRHTRSLQEETALRLYMTIKLPEAFMLNDLAAKIISYKFSKEEIDREREYVRRSKAYQDDFTNNDSNNNNKEK